jgi:serine/threonine protein kinase
MQRDRYEILGTLGCGATSRVDKARDKIIGRTVALKTLVHSFGAIPEQKLFLREAQIVGQLSHPSIVHLYDVGIEETGIAYLVMEYVPGRTLQQVLAEGPIPWPRACAWTADLAVALSRAHNAGIIHGDVKPANIMITPEGHVKLSDFGIARFATQVSGSGRIMGTPAYLSPEQILGEPQNTRSDLFSLGIVLYQMLAGVPPFEGSSVAAVCAQILSTEPPPPSQRNPALPAGIDHVVMRCLSKAPADRYPTGEALASSLYPLARHMPEPQPAVNVGWMSRPVRPREAWAMAAAVLLIGCSVPATHALNSLLQGSLLPASHFTAPKPPEDVLDVPGQEVAQGATLAGPIVQRPKVLAKKPAPRMSSASRRDRLAFAAGSPSRSVPVNSVPPAPALSAALPAPIPSAVERALLHIDIDATINEGTLAVFADHDLLLTTRIHAATPDDPVRLKQVLAVGPHQLRVALYRADKSLQTEKEGLAEIHNNSANVLKIRVSRRSKHLVRRETSLDVVWPGDTPSQPQTPQSISASAFTEVAK